MHEGDDTPRKLLVMFSTALVVESPKRCNEYIILLLLVPPPVNRSVFFLLRADGIATKRRPVWYGTSGGGMV